MTVYYLWPDPASPSGKSLLIRGAFGNGLAIDSKCCCNACCCDDLPDTLYAKVVHTCTQWTGAECASYERTDYFTFTKVTASSDDACARDTEFNCDKKQWHGVYQRTICYFDVDHWTTVTCDVHALLSCAAPQDADATRRAFALSHDFFTPDGASSGNCDILNGTSADCPITVIHFDNTTGGDIVDLWVQESVW